MVRNELSPQSNFSNHCIFTKTRPGAGFSQCELNPDSLPARYFRAFGPELVNSWRTASSSKSDNRSGRKCKI